jgi:uncharacterized phiE125 gp8 family phage protein
MNNISLVTDATVQPVTLSEMKTFMKVDLTDEEDLITSLIVSARDSLEKFAGVGMTTKIYDYYIQSLEDVISIPLPPLQSIDNFVYNDSSYSETEIDSSNYKVFAYKNNLKSEIVKLNTGTYPTSSATYNPYRIRFSNGYGDTANDVPEGMKTAIKLTVSHWFENRESQAIPPEAKSIMRMFKVYNL